MTQFNTTVFSIALILWIAIHSSAGWVEKDMLSRDSISVAEILENYIQASGGSALAEIRTEIRKGTLLRGVFGRVPLEIVAKVPGKWRYNQTFAWGDQICYGFDGSNAWIQDTKSIVKMNLKQRLDLQLMLDVLAPLRLQEFYPVMRTMGSEKIGEREAAIVLGTSQEGVSTELAFDLETGLLLRAGEIFFEDYRDIGPVKRPFRIILGKGEGEFHPRIIMQFTQILHDVEADDSLFQMPGCILPFEKPPLYTQRKQVEVKTKALEACVGVYQESNSMYTVTRQQSHLMIEWAGPQGSSGKIEIKPESETDYFIEFLNLEFHFVKDESGNVTHLEIGADRTRKAKKIK